MSQGHLPERGWRGSRELWLDAAYEMLIRKGVGAVKIMPLAASLNLSRTSFYWFFKDRRQLLQGLLDRWDEATTEPLVAATRDYAATETEAMLNVLAVFFAPGRFDTSIELAVRSWAQHDAEAQRRLQQADETRLAALCALLEGWGHAPDDADVRARTIYLAQIGYISMRVQESLSERLQRVPRYVEIYTDKWLPAQELERFKAQIGHRD
ncbi:TetR/AcrR family transcriptional regulator [Paracoccus sediminicola]|uniref:TetR/AcrR family transcriptional regulator n=1 Tax=Paracoccus sediminicola TaxID=3017783 RepID=UPI0022F01126|nr:TetR/AcrR family transcriptional regulator [Paracoccus sediminicola]WBU58321.1 TetR/AcrR family transcriptional regulator [Paracoccus sediminicola]